MNVPDDPDARLVDFLLGSLPDDAQAAVDEALFSDDELQGRLDATADDLIHDYLAGVLSEAQRTQFETHFLASSRHRQRLAFVRDLLSAVGRVAERDTVSDQSTTHARFRGWALAAGLLLATAAILVLWVGRAGRGPEQVSTSPATTLETPARLPSPLASIPSGPLPGGERPPAVSRPGEIGTIHVVRLPSQPTPDSNEIAVPAAARTVRLEVPVEEGPPSYEAAIRKASGGEVWRAKDLVAPEPGRPLVMMVPAEVLISADYVLTIEGEALRDATGSKGSGLEHRLRVVRTR